MVKTKNSEKDQMFVLILPNGISYHANGQFTKSLI